MVPTRTGLLIIRAWIEPASASPLRARIRLTTDVATGLESERTFADVQSVCTAVESWLQDVFEAEPYSLNN
jgi:hypothetical protein